MLDDLRRNTQGESMHIQTFMTQQSLMKDKIQSLIEIQTKTQEQYSDLSRGLENVTANCTQSKAQVQELIHARTDALQAGT
jgi:hypothetical protein